MHESTRHHNRRRQWCCSFTSLSLSPENSTTSTFPHSSSSKKKDLPSFHSPQSHPQKIPFSRWIHSPGRVSPISDIPPKQRPTPTPVPISPKTPISNIIGTGKGNAEIFDVQLNLKGKNGNSLVLELDSKVLANNSSVFRSLIVDYRRSNLNGGLCRIEVPDVENLSVFRETIELMLDEDDIHKKLLNIGVFRAIDVLEVSAGIKFSKCVSSCLKYIEAVPWTEEEEEKLRQLFPGLNLDDATITNILDRLSTAHPVASHRTLTNRLIGSVTSSTDANARNELKSLVKGLLCKSPIYEKDYSDLNKEDIYSVCKSCLSSLVNLFEETSSTDAAQKLTKNVKDKPLLERITKQVDNISWLFDILLDHQMAEEFVDLWANQEELLKMHGVMSPMVRYELSRVSAFLFIAMGSRKLHCRSERRLRFVLAWFRPMLSDFGWLQRCRKGLDMKALEETTGQTLLTLPLKEQYPLFMDWFQCFSKNGTECPNLSKAFQIWWRRSFLRGSETIESR